MTGQTGARRAMLAAAAALVAFALAVPARAGTEVSPPADAITIDVVAVNGSGCPAGTAAVAVSPDHTAFRVTYTRFTARTGGGAAATDVRKNCQLALSIHVPQGFTYAIARADYRGFAHLERDAGALLRTNYYFQGSSEDTFVDHTFTGPLHDYWHVTDTTRSADLVYAPCGVDRILNVNTQLRVGGGGGRTGAASYITMRATNGKVDTIYHFSWKRCS